MGENLIKPYEISVWEDELTQNGFRERKIAVIGSNTMTGFNKVYDPVFNKKSNGEKTLSFSLKYKYFDPHIGNEDVINPFAALLVNERKVKLHYDNQWYEFIVKEHSESSDGLEWTYTCTDAFVLELSKNGYNITFDTELNNNQGTAHELAKETLKDTDWQVGTTNVGKQMVAEPIYKASLVSTTGISIINASGTEDILPELPASIYLFYSYVKNQNGKNVQFIIRDENRQYTIDDKNVITDTNFRIITDLKFKDYILVDTPSGNPQDQKWYELNDTTYVLTTDTEVVANKSYYYLHPSFWNGQTEIISIGKTETRYQANRLVYGQRTTYDPVLQRTVDLFKADDREIYRYTDYTYTTSNVVTNLITNGDNFNLLEDGTLQGWNPYVDFYPHEEGDKIDKLELVTRPELGTGKELADLALLSQIEGFLKVSFKGALTDYKNAIFNSGIENNSSIIESISKGQEFVFRWRAGHGEVNALEPEQNLGLIVAKYTQDDPNPYRYYYKHIDPNNIIMRFEGTPSILNNYVRGGSLIEGEDGKAAYYINDVAQTPSTKYIYEVKEIIEGEEQTKEYIWNAQNGEFELKTDSNYLPYYYLTATADKAIKNSDLSDPTQKFGIFIYTTDGVSPIYIQDIQLTRFIEDAEGKPILIGNVPTATSNSTEYYYLKPEDGTAAEDVETYTSTDELAAELGIQATDIEPVYNVDSEKILSISVSQSNCFNILQTIAETFECWVDLVVEHDERGYITYSNDKPEKYVYLKEYAGEENWAGFKYGINLNSIERTINSEEFVTKLIVDSSQSDYVDEGFVSIVNAPSNQSDESYILNFDYYYNQGLLDRETTEEDKLNFISAIATKNLEIKEKEKQRRDLEAAMTSLGSNRNVFTELVETARDTQTRALAEFEALTGQTYEEYRQSHTSLEEDDQLTEEETIYDLLGELYVSSAAINNYSGILSNVDQEYWAVRKQLRGSENYNVKVWVDRDENLVRHIFVELSDYLPGFSFEIGGSTYTSTVSKKYWDLEKDDTEITFTAPEGYTIDTAQYTINDNKVGKFKITCSETVEGVEDEIEDLYEQKNELINDFNNKYSRFIQEGTWNSTDYIDSELYYLDALQVSNTSAQPAVSYTINVVEVSELEGLELYNFDAGDKTYIEDTEFFGWANVDGVLTPAREEVIVSEVEWHLDEPDQNVITVQNYKTRFEDLFQRISATVQTVQYNEATYAKISSLLDANGTINQNVLLESLNRISGKEVALTSNGSVIIQDDVVLIQNLNNPANRVIINSEGIRVSSDGGQNWQTAIDGQGINIGTVYTGTLNTNQVVIGSDDNPSFRWDKAGISAYKSNEETGVYDLQTFVRYDQYGLYGIKNNGTFKAQSLDDVLDKAHFAVTWDGFFIKNSYEGGGRVEITSDNDFRVLKAGGIEKVKIGALEWGKNGNIPITSPDAEGATAAPTLYGIRIKNDAGAEVMKTGDDGNLTITGTINANAGVFDGNVQVGTSTPHIDIDGVNAVIKSSNYNDGSSTSATYGWMINADGDAVFNNITARGAIKTAVFEYAEIQAVGGIFIFRPSSTIREAVRVGDTDDIKVTIEKPHLFTVGDWCKISNYIDTMGEPSAEAVISDNGLTHVYKIKSIDTNNSRVLILENAYTALTSGSTKVINNITDLIGGALVDMGNKNNGDGKVGTNNYGIGINSSDNVVNLPRRAISLFETVVDETKNPKVSYNYRGILGTLPHMDSNAISPIYPAYMEGKQGIYTDNMYIGDKNQYIAFYKDAQGNSQLRLVAKSFEILPDDSDLPIDLGDSIVDQKVQYTLSTSDSINTLEEEWSDIPYEVTEGYYQWQRTYVKYAKGRIDYLPSEDGYYMSSEAGQPGPQGPPGQAGEDAINLVIDSSNGNTFKNSSVNTILSVTIYKGTIIIKDIVHLKEIFGNTAYLQWYWKRMGESDFHPISIDDSMLSNGGFNLTLTPDKVDVKVVFQCEIITTES